jgi:hypothetical protein
VEARDGRQPLRQRLFSPVDAASTSFLRLVVGVILVCECVRFHVYGWIDTYFVLPTIRFGYFGFDWLQPLPGDGMHLVFLGIAASAAAVTLGYRYRTAIALLATGWTYVNLLDQSTYLNHAYLLSLACVLLAVLPAPLDWSLDARRRAQRGPHTTPAWSLWLLRFQIAVPYVFGGISKLDSDWLHGQPLQVWMSRMTHLHERVPAFGEPWLATLFSYGGLVFDLAVVPALLCRRTRVAAFAVALAFHGLNAAMFHIGVFPWLMMFATTIFFEPGWPRSVLRWASGNKSTPAGIPLATESPAPPVRNQPWILIGIATWIVVQILIPFRHLLYPGDVAWTDEGSKFAWRMMLFDKVTALRITATNLADGTARPIDPRDLLTPKQLERMSTNPELLALFCRHVGDTLRRAGHPQAEIHVLALCSLNFRRPQLLVDPAVDLSRVSRSIRPQTWIVPLREPLREQPWLVPMSQWERQILGRVPSPPEQ